MYTEVDQSKSWDRGISVSINHRVLTSEVININDADEEIK